MAFYVDQQLQQRHIPFRRETSCYIGACALGNRDKCTTWFDSIRYVCETPLAVKSVAAHSGVAEAWIGPLREASSTEGFILRVEDSAGNVGDTLGPLWPHSRAEGAQRVAVSVEPHPATPPPLTPWPCAPSRRRPVAVALALTLALALGV